MKELAALFARIRAILKTSGELRPTRDWLVILLVSAALLAASVIWNVVLFLSVAKEHVVGNETTSHTLDTAPLDTVRLLFETREAEESRYRNEYRFVDPSL